MKKSITYVAAIICSSLFFPSCTKDAGEGGTSSIQGKVTVKIYNPTFQTLLGEYNDANDDVQIIYGNDISIGGRIKTSYDGRYEFQYLRKGSYKVFVYSQDSSSGSTSGTTAIIKEVEVTGKKQIVTVPDITILKTQSKGYASIKGKIMYHVHPHTSFQTFLGAFPALGEDVYLSNSINVSIPTRIKSAYDGSYEFDNLFPGTYKLYSFTLDSTQVIPEPVQTYTEIQNIVITDKNQVVTANDIIVHKKFP